MSPLAEEVIQKLSKEQDKQVLIEVLDFYEYLKQKKQKELQKKWDNIEENKPNVEEIKIYNEYKNSEEDLISLETLVRELDLDEQ